MNKWLHTIDQLITYLKFYGTLQTTESINMGQLITVKF